MNTDDTSKHVYFYWLRSANLIDYSSVVLIIDLCVTVCVGDGADFPAFNGSIWVVQTQSHDLHHQPQHRPEEVSLYDDGASVRYGGAYI